MTDLHADTTDHKDVHPDDPCPASPVHPDEATPSGLMVRKASDVHSIEKSIADSETPEKDQDKEKASEDGQDELESGVDVEPAVEEANTAGTLSDTQSVEVQSDLTSGQPALDSSIAARLGIQTGDPAAYGLDVPPLRQKKKTFSAKAASFTKNLWKNMKHAATSTASTSHRAMPQVDTRIAPLEPREIP
ncbi:MAG: uncharacterized protein KVP18_000503 [Porospora cf. gigantea A]|uniref:uncharacterized protein n=1 Tax=Porospora cf. gigantea A TaxID=2853593 RepID=UPI00355A085F|nr:MAG: hypothetical protein KVP18_000503 [Porospora cf. gigantea A]